MLLQELLDETEGNTRYKYRLKNRINALQKELDQLLNESIDSDELSLYITNASAALDKALDQKL